MTKKKAKMMLTGDELRSKLAERARRMPWRQFSDSLLPDEHRELTFFGGSVVDFWRTYNADETLRRQALEQPKKSHAQIKREVDEILAGKHDGTSGAGSLPEPRRFRVDVQNQPRRIFNSAEEALNHGMRRVYLHWPKTSEMLERLKRGEPAAWAYGFTPVEIAPL